MLDYLFQMFCCFELTSKLVSGLYTYYDDWIMSVRAQVSFRLFSSHFSHNSYSAARSLCIANVEC